MAHNGAVMVRIRQHHVSKRAQKFRRFLGLKSLRSMKSNSQKLVNYIDGYRREQSSLCCQPEQLVKNRPLGSDILLAVPSTAFVNMCMAA